MKIVNPKMGYGIVLFLLCLLLCAAPALADTVIPVSSHDDIVQAINSHLNQTFTLELQGDITLGGAPAILIPAGANVTLTNKAGIDVAVVRNLFGLKSSSRIDINGSLTIVENKVGGGSLLFDGALDYCAGSPQLAVWGDGSQLTIESGSFIDQNSGYGAIYSADGATTTINGGTFTGNRSSFNPFNQGTGQGAVIWAANSNLIINGGTFDGNTADLIGGVVYYEGRTQANKLLVTGGTFTNNTAKGAFGGGAIFIDCSEETGKTFYSKAEITGGVFDGNKAPIGTGGAVYIQKHAEVKIGDSSIWHNHATGDGGGIWNCATGGGGYYSFHGMYLSDNAADNKGDDFYSVPKQQADSEVYLTDYAYTSAKYNWEYDDGVHAPGTLAPNEYYQDSEEEIALISGLPSGEEPHAKVFFRNNVGLTGGAIANNGILQMGEATVLAVKKQTTTTTSEMFHFQTRLQDKNDQPMSGSFLYRNNVTGALGHLTFDVNGVGLLELVSGQEITLLDMPLGTHYTVTEVAMPDGWELKSPNGVAGEIRSATRIVPVHNIEFLNAPAVPTPVPTPIPVPITGDDQPIGGTLALIALALMGMLAVLLIGCRSRKHCE